MVVTDVPEDNAIVGNSFSHDGGRSHAQRATTRYIFSRNIKNSTPFDECGDEHEGHVAFGDR